MPKSQSTAALIGLVALLIGESAAASSLRFSVRGGRVTIVATDVTVREILAEWERVGHTVITNLDQLKGPRVTLELHEVPEAAALAVLLRSASGYVALPRTTPTPTGSVFQSILILASSSSPAPPVAVTARAPSPPDSLPRVVPSPVPATNAREWPSPHTPGNPAALNGSPPAPGASAGSASSPRFAPLSAAERAGLRLTRQRQQEVLFGGSDTSAAGSAPPPSTDASRPGTVTTVAPRQQQPGPTRR